MPKVLVALGFLVAGALSPALAADQAVAGKKLLLKNPPAGPEVNKLVLLARDGAVAVEPAGGAGDPQCTGAGGGGSSSLRVIAGGAAGDVTIALPCSGWTTNRANSVYKYKDRTGVTCGVVLVKNGVLAKAVCKGAQMAIAVGPAMAPVAVIATLNTARYCAEFGGELKSDGSDGRRFLAKDAPTPASCPVTPGGCVDDADCLGSGQVCTGGACAPCTDVDDDARCGSGAACVGGVCTPGACHADGQCTAPNTCLDNRCGCVASTSCGGAVCVGGLCTPCATDQQCLDGYGPSFSCSTNGACVVG